MIFLAAVSWIEEYGSFIILVLNNMVYVFHLLQRKRQFFKYNIEK